jgi:hypothetical protein
MSDSFINDFMSYDFGISKGIRSNRIISPIDDKASRSNKIRMIPTLSYSHGRKNISSYAYGSKACDIETIVNRCIDIPYIHKADTLKQRCRDNGTIMDNVMMEV